MAIRAFKSGRKDVLVATDVASKGLDFPNVQHVINYDMPEDIDNYTHRIGRTGSYMPCPPVLNTLSFFALVSFHTGRCGKTGVATTFVNLSVSQTTLIDLKHLLIEARQRVPQFLADMHSESEQFLTLGGFKGCSYCGGLGHRIAECPRRTTLVNKQTAAIGRSDRMAKTSSDY